MWPWVPSPGGLTEMFEVNLIAKFDTEEEARAALADLEEVVGRHDGDLEDNTITEEEA